MPKAKTALVIGGGAPNMPLMAGALSAMIRQRVRFDIISTSGAGALVGLLYAAPKSGNPIAALAGMVQMGIADPIYRLLPVNYKVFNKPGPLAEQFRSEIARSPFAQWVDELSQQSPAWRAWADWVRLMWAIATPTDLSMRSLGLCAHVPFIEEVVDFQRLADASIPIYLNAYNLDRHQMVQWEGPEITVERFRAALSFPFLYPPTVIANEAGEPEHYIEGAALDTLNFKALVGPDGVHPEIDTLVVFDVLGADQLLRPPRDLYDAWVMSIITPLVEIAKDDLKLFDLVYNRNPDGTEKRHLLIVPLLSPEFPKSRWAEMFDWTYSNMYALYRAGFDIGLDFCREHADKLDIVYDESVLPLPENWTLADALGTAAR
ncbi:patatin-like phospholipase family protein [Chitiniphilus purpureus]|uniref:Patatin-like phospholipase family protein n=1 Tax=Chitiniphilus purpureus TaxID=2981137 RepID=A0ABY6DLQ1_9NEIS|nr:patatin-like phospholipase family protein [Chitiniphilus sp. CD1]UXY15295.1 patatin-like phospholipase family protein [Chitiniphilus sp. CD1]